MKASNRLWLPVIVPLALAGIMSVRAAAELNPPPVVYKFPVPIQFRPPDPRALHTSVNYFYEGLTEAPPAPGSNLPKEVVQQFLMTPEGVELAASFPKVEPARLRRKFIELIRTLVDDR